MMEKELKAPKLRFPGFTDDWEQRELRDISDKVTIKNKDCEFSETFTNSAEFGIVCQVDFFDHSVSKEDNIDGYYIVRDNDFVYNPRISNLAPVGPINRNKLGRTGVMSPLYTVFKTHDVEESFLEWFFKSSAWHSFMRFNGDSGARSDRFSIKDNVFFTMPIQFPKMEEQRKIGQFFNKVDNLITLHQRKLDTLKKLKKGFLQKMFPKNGESVPEIRFPGFTDAWEQRKFGDVFNEYSEKKHPELPALTIIQGTGTILRDESDRKLQYDKASLVNYKLVNKDDLIVHLRSFEGGLEKANSEGIVSPAYHIFHGENTDTRFYYPFFRSRRFIDVLLKPHVYGIRDGKSIDIEGMKTISIPVPSYEEQEKVGDFIEKLDNLITLHQRKLDTLKKFKQGMLQQMFI